MFVAIETKPVTTPQMERGHRLIVFSGGYTMHRQLYIHPSRVYYKCHWPRKEDYMQSLQDEILDLLGDREVDADELVKLLSEKHKDLLTFDIRSALLPLMSTGLVEWAKEGTIRATNPKVLTSA
ncbi:MAG TPA: hypothetical protein V6D22_18960 [Candidatus Obscuribacterales bacterium]